jgi:hypothetical protein
VLVFFASALARASFAPGSRASNREGTGQGRAGQSTRARPDRERTASVPAQNGGGTTRARHRALIRPVG